MSVNSPSTQPNSNLVSAMMMPISRAWSCAHWKTAKEASRRRCAVSAPVSASTSAIVIGLVVAGLRLGGGGEHQLGQAVAVRQALGRGQTEDGSAAAVLGEGGAGEIGADDALNVDAIGAAHDHRLARHVRGQAGEARVRGEAVERGGVVRQADEVVGDDVAGAVEPESGEAAEDVALVGHAVGQHHVEGGDAVGGDHQEVAVVDVVGVAHLAPVPPVGEGAYRVAAPKRSPRPTRAKSSSTWRV